jgi:hypothetical protein
MRAQFGGPKKLVEWHLTKGRASFGGQRAIQYDRDGSGVRDPFSVQRGQALFALTTLCLDAVDDERQRTVLEYAYMRGLTDGQIADRIAKSETTVRTWRCRGLRAAGDRARALRSRAVDPVLGIGAPLVPEDR